MENPLKARENRFSLKIVRNAFLLKNSFQQKLDGKFCIKQKKVENRRKPNSVNHMKTSIFNQRPKKS